MLGGDINLKVFFILTLLAIGLGFGLSKIAYPELKNPVVTSRATSTDHVTLPFVFPEQEALHPLKKIPVTPPSATIPAKEDEPCIQVITPAVNRQTLEIRQFPTPCDVPEGWDILR